MARNMWFPRRVSATHCNTLQPFVTHCNTLQHCIPLFKKNEWEREADRERQTERESAGRRNKRP